MATKTSVNGQTVVHKTSEGMLIAGFDVCMTPIGNAVVPVPYTNVALSQHTSNGSKRVRVDGNPVMLKDAVFSKSTGGEAGTGGGITSGRTCGTATFHNYSFDVKIEGRNVCRRLDLMTSNKGNTPPAPLMQPNAEPDGSEKESIKYPLSLAFVYLHPEEHTDRITQPDFQTLHTLRGPETLRQESHGYVGAQHLCEQPGGDYEVVFDEFDVDDESFE